MNENKKKILVVAREPEWIRLLKDGLLSAGYEIRFAEDGETAAEISKAFPPDAILADIDVPDKFFRQVKENPQTTATPLIFIGDQPNLEDRIKLMELAIDDYIRKPVEVEEVVARLQLVLDEIKKVEEAEAEQAAGFSGRLQEMNLVDLIQTLELGKKTGLLSLRRNKKEGKVFLRDGEVINAVANGLEGEKAIYSMFTWLEGNFRVEFKEIEQPRKIEIGNKELLYEGMRRINEWELLKDQLPPFTSILEVAYRPQKGDISEEEENFFDLFNGERNILEVIEESGRDELEALKWINEYFQKGYLNESLISIKEQTQDLKEERKPSKRAKLGREKMRSVITALFKKTAAEEPREETWVGEERRKIPDRRVAPRRKTDMIRLANKIPLRKSELLLIREKLR